jgi:hypothetical protein
MYDQEKRCQNFNTKAHAHSTERFFARAGVFKYGFVDYDEFKLVKSNIYRNQDTLKSARMQLVWAEGGLTVTTIDGLFSGISESCDDDHDNVPFTFDCWKIHSPFIIYSDVQRQSPCCIARLSKINPRKLQTGFFKSHFPAMRISFRCSSNCCDVTRVGHRCFHLILSWFDRVDRMIFWKCSTRLYSKLTEFQSLFPLILVVNQYL